MTRRPAMGRGKATVVSCIAGVVAIVVGCQLPAPTPPAPTVKENAVALTVPDRLRADSAALTDMLKYDALFERLKYDTLFERLRYDTLIARLKYDTLFALDSARFRDRVREQEADADLLLRLRENAAQKYMDFKILDSALRAPTAQTYMELQIAVDRLQQQMGQFSPMANDSLRRINDGVAALMRQLDSVAHQSRRMIDSIPDYALKLSRAARAMAGDSLYFFSDSAAAVQRTPGCSARGADDGSALLKLLVPDEDAMRAGFIAVTSADATGSGASIEFGGTRLMCQYSRSGELRLYGRGAFDAAPIIVRSREPIFVVVMTGSGRILAGPMVVQNDSRRYELTWSPR